MTKTQKKTQQGQVEKDIKRNLNSGQHENEPLPTAQHQTKSKILLGLQSSHFLIFRKKRRILHFHDHTCLKSLICVTDNHKTVHDDYGSQYTYGSAKEDCSRTQLEDTQKDVDSCPH